MTENDLKELLSLVAKSKDTPRQILDGPWPDYDLFAAIAMKESSGNPLAHYLNSNTTIDRGLWQINSIHEQEMAPLLGPRNVKFRTACYTPMLNALMAVVIFQKHGYKAWSTFNELA